MTWRSRRRDRRWPRAPWLPAAVLLALAAVCFAHLIMHPGALLVDGRRPSIDHANRRRPAPDRQRPDLRLPSASPRDQQGDSVVRPSAHVGCPGIWRAALGRQPAGRPVLSARLGRLVGAAVASGLAHGRPSGLGRDGCLCALAVGRSRSVGGDGGCRRSTWLRRSCSRIRSRVITRTSGRRPGIPGRSGPSARRGAAASPAARSCPFVLAMAFLAGHPQEWLLLVLALAAWSLADAVGIWRSRGASTAAARLVVCGRRGGALAGTGRNRPGAAACGAALAAARSRRVRASERPQALSPGGSERISVALPDGSRWAGRLFRQRQLLGDPALDWALFLLCSRSVAARWHRTGSSCAGGSCSLAWPSGLRAGATSFFTPPLISWCRG